MNGTFDIDHYVLFEVYKLLKTKDCVEYNLLKQIAQDAAGVVFVRHIRDSKVTKDDLPMYFRRAGDIVLFLYSAQVLNENVLNSVSTSLQNIPQGFGNDWGKIEYRGHNTQGENQ